MPNSHGHFALRDITDSAGRSLIKQLERLLIFLIFRSPQAGPLNPPRCLGIACIATEPIQTDPVVARQAPQMVQTRQGLALLPAVVRLRLDVQGVREPALRDLLTPALSKLEAHACQSGTQICRCKIVHRILSFMPRDDFIVSQDGFDDAFYYLVDYIQKTNICS